jgi:hypothetical protein
MPVKALHVNWDTLRRIFGERWWNDTEDLICAVVSKIVDPHEICELDCDVPNWRDYHYLISEL